MFETLLGREHSVVLFVASWRLWACSD